MTAPPAVPEVAPASPPPAARTIVFNPRIHCGAKGKQTGQPCRNAKGWRTDHPRSGRCKLHGGNSPNGKRYARKQAAVKALEKLGRPAGSGDPFELLRDVNRIAHGQVVGLCQMVVESAAEVLAGRTPRVPLVETIELLDRALRTGGLVAKELVDSHLADAQTQLAQAQGEVLLQVVTVALNEGPVTGDVRQRVEEALVRELAAVTPGGDELN